MAENPDLQVVYTFVEALSAAGVGDVCISPGSRSTPLTLAFARSGHFRIWTLLDERSAGFFAVGLARVGRPVALVCTSGSATANYYPAVMEASAARLPLLVLTADRPPEMHQVGANQTTTQTQLYVPLVKCTINMPVPVNQPDLHRHAEATAWRLMQVATAQPAGPVHLNWPLREPLIPPPREPGDVHRRVRRTYTAVSLPHPDAIGMLHEVVTSSHRGLVICGPQSESAFAEAVLGLAARLQVPVIADVLSQTRRASDEGLSTCVVDTHDLWIRDADVANRVTPDWILQFGGTPTSKPLAQFLQQRAGRVRHVIVDVDANWRDATFSATDIVTGDATAVCQALCERLDPRVDTQMGTQSDARIPAQWRALWQALQTAARDALTDAVARSLPRDAVGLEGRILLELAEHLTGVGGLFLGNSMPVRDAESFLPALPASVQVLANRGVSGIDGVVSSAAGAAAGLCKKTVLVIGDVSFYHDQNGLLAAAQNHLDLLVVLVNNDGGGIFSFLPQANYPDTFSQFRTAHGLDFKPVVEMYGGEYQRADDWTTFRDTLPVLLERPGLRVLEVRTNIDENVRLHRELSDEVRCAVRAVALA